MGMVDDIASVVVPASVVGCSVSGFRWCSVTVTDVC